MQSTTDRQSFGRLRDGLHAGRTLARAGLWRPHRPDRLIGAARQIARWGQSSAGAYAAGVQLRPGELAVIDDIGELTFAEVHERTDRLAAALADEGIGQGDSVALMCRNHRGFVETVVALSKRGASTLLLNTGFAGPQLAEVVKRENPSAVVYDQEFSDLVAGALDGRQGFVAWVDQAERGERVTHEQLIEWNSDDDRHLWSRDCQGTVQRVKRTTTLTIYFNGPSITIDGNTLRYSGPRGPVGALGATPGTVYTNLQIPTNGGDTQWDAFNATQGNMYTTSATEIVQAGGAAYQVVLTATADGGQPAQEPARHVVSSPR